MARALHSCALPSTRRRKALYTSIWSVPVAGGEAPRPLTKAITTHAALVTGRKICAVPALDRKKMAKPEPPQLAMLPMAGGDSFVLPILYKRRWQSGLALDGKNIAFTNDRLPRGPHQQERKKARNPPLPRLRRTRATPTPASKTDSEHRERRARDHARGVSTRQ